MNSVKPDELHRLVKMALDSGEARNLEEAFSIFAKYRLRLHLGKNWNQCSADEIAAITILNIAPRAFVGGVLVSGSIDDVFTIPFSGGRTVREVAVSYGAVIADTTEDTLPTLVIGGWNERLGKPDFAIRPVYSGWACAIQPQSVPTPFPDLAANAVSPVAAAALAVNEAFLYTRRELPDAGQRQVGLSLWAPKAVNSWAEAASLGPVLRALPQSAWLVGLGHLGQAYAWVLSFLPYLDPSKVQFFLQDVDAATVSNLSTGVLTLNADIGRRKTRIVADWLDRLGYRTNIQERYFSNTQIRQSTEPGIALFGVDNPEARSVCEGAGFNLVVEAGLGSGHQDFRTLRTHTFPSERRAADIWKAMPVSAVSISTLAPAYQTMLEESGDECGTVLIAGKAVATPFVGMFAAALVVAEVLRSLNDGERYSVIDMSLRNIRNRQFAVSTQRLNINPGYIAV